MKLWSLCLKLVFYCKITDAGGWRQPRGPVAVPLALRPKVTANQKSQEGPIDVCFIKKIIIIIIHV